MVVVQGSVAWYVFSQREIKRKGREWRRQDAGRLGFLRALGHGLKGEEETHQWVEGEDHSHAMCVLTLG
jgi:hypothetical protein